MKNFIYGLMVGLFIEVLMSVIVYGLFSYVSTGYVDSSSFILEYPLLLVIITSAYASFVKKSYKFALGVIFGYLLSFILIAFVLGMNGGV